jgi:vacuolar protein sorting-associated protein 26
MELSLIRRESVGSGPNAVIENEVLTKFEIMDGAPVKGEVVPIRFYLASTDLTPSYKNVNNRLSVKYMLSLVLFDEEDRRYFKQQEIDLWRKKI